MLLSHCVKNHSTESPSSNIIPIQKEIALCAHSHCVSAHCVYGVVFIYVYIYSSSHAHIRHRHNDMSSAEWMPSTSSLTLLYLIALCTIINPCLMMPLSTNTMRNHHTMNCYDDYTTAKLQQQPAMASLLACGKICDRTESPFKWTIKFI